VEAGERGTLQANGFCFVSPRSSLGASAALLGAASLLSRVAGVLRDRAISSRFGAGPEADAFLAAFRAPDAVYNLLVLGAVTAGFVPVFAAIVAKRADDDGRHREAWQFASRLLAVLGVGLGLAALAGIALAPWFVPRLVPGFDDQTTALTVTLTRIMFVSPVLLGFSSVFGGSLQSLRRFTAYAFAPVLYNVGIILGATVLAPEMGAAGLAYGVLVGALLHMALQWLACRRAGFRFGFGGRAFDGNVRKVLRLMVPRTLALGVGQLNTLVLTGVASGLGAGAVSVLWFANNLQSLPVGVVGVSFAVASFPVIAELLARGDRKAAALELGRVVRMTLYLVIPATVLLLTLRAQAVRLVLGAGNFNWEDTLLTANTLAMFCIGIFAQALSPILARAFFALEDATTPLVVAVVSVMGERVLAAWLVANGHGVAWVAFAASMGSILGLGMLWVLLRRKLGSLGDGKVLRSLVTLTAAGALMAVAAQWAERVVEPVTGTETFVGLLLQSAFAASVAAATYLVVTWLLGNEEARLMVSALRRKLLPGAASGIVQDEGKLEV
jgi:putative peptidoglycan lipid II flippase